ncbi:MAG TPA: hypothetical protein PLS25_08880, partial [Methanoregulaceae archaeon]|nr:hypothetical protein [Methanoregulaceae archaeon]
LYGGAWFAGSIVLGILYELDIRILVGYTVVMQAAALVAFFRLWRAVKDIWKSPDRMLEDLS